MYHFKFTKKARELYNKDNFKSNILYAFSAQFFSLSLSFIMALIVPKLLGVEEYAYWQLFLFYSSYVGLFALGFNDGIYLKLGGKQYDELNFTDIGSQIRLNILFQIFTIIIIITMLCNYVDSYNRIFILVATGVFAIINNLNANIGYMFQAVNKTKIFSISTIIEQSVFLIALLTTFFFHLTFFQPLVLIYISAKIIALIYTLYNGRKIIFAKQTEGTRTIKNMIGHMLIGMNLMFANIASMLIVGFGRKLIDIVWGVSVFGKFSLALSLCNFFLAFIGQVSMVLFPTLRQSSNKQLEKIYTGSRSIISLFLPMIFILYFPMRFFLEKWLPAYADSLVMLGFLLPLCTYDGKMQLLCNTYFKVFRKEKILLRINIISMLLSFVLSILGAYLFKSINFIVIGMVIAIAFRSIFSEILLARMMKKTILTDLISENIIVMIYLFCLYVFEQVIAWGISVAAYTLYFVISTNRKRRLTIIPPES